MCLMLTLHCLRSLGLCGFCLRCCIRVGVVEGMVVALCLWVFAMYCGCVWIVVLLYVVDWFGGFVCR